MNLNNKHLLVTGVLAVPSLTLLLTLAFRPVIIRVAPVVKIPEIKVPEIKIPEIKIPESKINLSPVIHIHMDRPKIDTKEIEPETPIIELTPVPKETDLGFVRMALEDSVATERSVFVKEVYRIESDNNYTAVEPRSRAYFGVCQLNSYWGTRFAKETGLSWEEENTTPKNQDIFCNLRFDSIESVYKRTGMPMGNLPKYMAHQLGINGSHLIWSYIKGETSDIPSNVVGGLINNLNRAGRTHYHKLQKAKKPIPLDKLLRAWVTRFIPYFS